MSPENRPAISRHRVADTFVVFSCTARADLRAILKPLSHLPPAMPPKKKAKSDGGKQKKNKFFSCGDDVTGLGSRGDGCPYRLLPEVNTEEGDRRAAREQERQTKSAQRDATVYAERARREEVHRAYREANRAKRAATAAAAKEKRARNLEAKAKRKADLLSKRKRSQEGATEAWIWKQGVDAENTANIARAHVFFGRAHKRVADQNAVTTKTTAVDPPAVDPPGAKRAAASAAHNAAKAAGIEARNASKAKAAAARKASAAASAAGKQLVREQKRLREHDTQRCAWTTKC